MKTEDKIDKYIDEKKYMPTIDKKTGVVWQGDPKKKKAYDDYKKAQKEASGIINAFKTKLRNHQNRFFQASELDLNYLDDIKYLVKELKDLYNYFK